MTLGRREIHKGKESDSELEERRTMRKAGKARGSKWNWEEAHAEVNQETGDVEMSRRIRTMKLRKCPCVLL